MIEQNLDLIFKAPTDTNFYFNQKRSCLWLLRRDVYQLLGYDPNTAQKDNKFQEALWPAAMCILAGFDLLTKLDCLKDKASGEEFKAYLKKYGGLSLLEREVIYQYRCALVHSFGLFAESYNGEIFHFHPRTHSLDLIITVDKDNYEISIPLLHLKFEETISKLDMDYRKRPDVDLEKFDHIFKRYFLDEPTSRKSNIF